MTAEKRFFGRIIKLLVPKSHPLPPESKLPGLPMTPDETLAIAVQWLASLGASTDAAAFTRHFAPTGWLRDLLCFSWDFRTMAGRAQILEFLADASAGGASRFARAGLHDFNIDVTSQLGPPAVIAPPGNPNGLGISAVFTFSVAAPPAKGRGLVRLVPDPEGGWQAFTLFTDLQHLNGHAEPSGRPVGYLDTTWEDVQATKVAAIERDPTVLIVGAGQTGLMCAARFGRMGIRALVLEKTARVGDVWRNRYPNLSLHTKAHHSSLLYQAWPETYPEFLPRDKIADFLEAYAVGQEIHVWLSSAMIPGPTYDNFTGRWSVEIDRAGKRVTLAPKHIVVATGIGKQRVPTWPGIDSFRGPVYHSDDHKGAAPFEGKKVIVVGGCNAGADMCKDFVHKGAAEVTMVQRSATCVISAGTADELMFRPAAHLPPEEGDFMFNATPPALLLKLAVGGGTQRLKALDTDLHDNLAKAGFKLTWQLNPGEEEVGFLGLFFERTASGSMIDMGFSQLVIEGKVKVKPVDIERIEPDGMVFEDGSKISADVIVLATGNEPIIAGVASNFGEGITERIGSKIWGLDSKGELTNCYRPTGVAGLWFVPGAFQHGRYLSRHLAIQILAEELGLKD
ncbi:FAD/NAD(P)-binding domain-containing protein [Mycena belliarum]|uniref:FAD/NAD(P)-binding domain-containing protein n=1 Tax=Mycena belliarum TaxID=1033014 RepID=A0AAD6XEH3_9AGAR|nr:FAD/NAD(P)-binding domain-containing protein [Mycena belliae]